MENKEVVYFSVNNWMCGENYPPLDCFRKWLGDDLNQTFRNDTWCKENKLCVYYGVVDMSQNYTVSAPREWVEKNMDDVFDRLGANLDKDGPGAMRRIPQKDLDELKRIYDVTGATEMLENVTRAGLEKARELGLTEEEYCQKLYSECSPKHFNH